MNFGVCLEGSGFWHWEGVSRLYFMPQSAPIAQESKRPLDAFGVLAEPG